MKITNRQKKSAFVVGVLLLAAIAYQNFTPSDSVTNFASKKPLIAQDINPFNKSNVTTAQHSLINLIKANNLIYNTYVQQADLTSEAGYSEHYVKKIAISNTTFIDKNSFNQVLPDILPSAVASLIFRGTININGQPALNEKGLKSQSTFTLALFPEINSAGQVVYIERLVSSAHHLNLNQINSAMSIVLEGSNDATPVSTYQITASDLGRVRAQVEARSQNFDFITITPPSQLMAHPDVVHARNSGLIPVVDGSAIHQVNADTPLITSGYSMIYNPDVLVSARESAGAGRVQPDSQIMYLADSNKNLIQTIGEIGGGILLPDVGHSGGPLLVNQNGKWIMVGTMIGGAVMGPDLAIIPLTFAKLPDSNGNLGSPSTNSDISALWKSSQTAAAITKIKEKKGLNSTSCQYFRHCVFLDNSDLSIERVNFILMNKENAISAAAQAKRRLQDLTFCFVNSGHCSQTSLIQSVFMPALNLPTDQLYQGLKPEFANSLIFLNGGYSLSEVIAGQVVTTGYKWTTTLFNSNGVPVLKMPNPGDFWSLPNFQINPGP